MSGSDQRIARAWAVAILAKHLDPSDGERACDRVLIRLLHEGDGPSQGERLEDQGDLYPDLICSLSEPRAKALAWELSRLVFAMDDSRDVSLSGLLDDNGREQAQRRACFVSLQIAQTLSSPFSWAAALVAMPNPCRLTTQELVELLKMPTCFGLARRVVLDNLGNRYGRRFVNHWDFVHFATEQGLGLNFTTPPSASRCQRDGGEDTRRSSTGRRTSGMSSSRIEFAGRVRPWVR